MQQEQRNLGFFAWKTRGGEVTKEENDHGGRKKGSKNDCYGERKKRRREKGRLMVEQRESSKKQTKGQPLISVGDLRRRPTELCGDRTGFVITNQI